MNQSIQFHDREWRDEEKKAICFPAMVNGFQVLCAIQEETLFLRFGAHDDALACFRRHRLDLEDAAEEAIKAECDDLQGWFWLF